MNRPEYKRDACELYLDPTLQNPIFRSAFLLDPRYRGDGMGAEEIDSATRFLLSIATNEELLKFSITNYLGDSAPYNSRLLQRDSPAWWKAGRRFGFDPDLSDIADNLAACVCSSAALERSFSTMRVTYGELRTRLGVETAGKLTFIHRSLLQRSSLPN